MTDSKITDSDLDLNERNSWTVLCECNVTEKSSSEKCAPTTDESNDLVLVRSNESFEKLNPTDVTNTSDDSSNLNEDVVDAEIVHDRECKPAKVTCRSRSKKKRHGRNKSRDIGTFFIIGTVLAITGASLLCLLVPKGTNLETSNVSQLKTNCSKLGITKENTQTLPPIKAAVSRYGSKTIIKDRDGSLQAYLSNQGFSPNTSTVFEAAKCFGPPTYQAFEKKIDAFNKQCPKTSLAETTPKTVMKPYAPMIKVKPQPSKMSQKLIPAIESSPSRPQTTSENHTPLHCKLICDVLQDLALLKLTQVIARRMSEKAAKRKKRMETKKKTTSKSESLLRLQKRISKTTVSLWDELPFNKQIALKPTMSAIVEEDDARRVSSKMSLTEIGAARCMSMEKQRRRQLEYLAKLKREHSDRMAYLKGIRERQQESIQALIQERKQDFSKLDAYANHQNHILEGKRRLLEINNYYTKLKNGLASKSALALNSRVNSQICKKIISLSNFPTTCSDNDGAACLQPETIVSEGTKEKNVASPFYLSARKKYYEQIASYWSKREEYLNERINFMREAADSLKEVMTRFRNTNADDCSDSKCALVNIISEASLVFPENANLQRLKSEAQMIDPCNTLTKNESFLQLNRYRSLHNFGKDRPRRFSLSTSEELKDDVLYNELFGKKGTQIRKRDLAVWNCSKFQKPLQKELIQQEVRKRHVCRKGNKELKIPDLTTK